MRSKRTVIIIVIVSAVLVVGIGYAALNDRLVVTGDVSVGVNEFSPSLYFSDATVTSYEVANGATTGVTVQVDDESAEAGDVNDKVSITVPNTVLTSKGDKVTVEAVIANASEKYDAKVTINSGTSATAGLYSVTCTWKDSGGSAPATIGKNGGSATVSIVIELLKDSATPVNSDKFEITYTAESVG